MEAHQIVHKFNRCCILLCEEFVRVYAGLMLKKVQSVNVCVIYGKYIDTQSLFDFLFGIRQIIIRIAHRYFFWLEIFGDKLRGFLHSVTVKSGNVLAVIFCDREADGAFYEAAYLRTSECYDV